MGLYPVGLQSAYGEHSANRCNSDVIGPFIEPDYSFVRLYLTHQYVFLLRKRNRGSVMGSRRRRPARKTVRCHLCRPARALNLRPTAAAASRLTSLGSLQSRRRSSRTGRPRAAAALGARGRSMTRSETGQPATGHPAVSRPDRTVEIKRRKRRASARPQGGSAELAEVFDENGDWTLKSKHLERWRPTPFLNTYLAGPKPPPSKLHVTVHFV